MNKFSFKDYKLALKSIKSQHKTFSFRDCAELGYDKIINTKKFVIMRHDIEASVDQALKLAELDAKENISSSFFFLLTGDYNIFSEEDAPKIFKIIGLGHDIGLHYDASFLSSFSSNLSNLINYQSKLIESFFSIKVYAASCHKPMRYGKLSNTGKLINTYDSKYMVDIKYISDSNQSWREGGIIKNLKEFDKIQLLTHDICWSDKDLSFDEILLNNLSENHKNKKIKIMNMIKDMRKGLKMRSIKDKEFKNIYMKNKKK